jgi:hypothetical protein
MFLKTSKKKKFPIETMNILYIKSTGVFVYLSVCPGNFQTLLGPLFFLMGFVFCVS